MSNQSLLLITLGGSALAAITFGAVIIASIYGWRGMTNLPKKPFLAAIGVVLLFVIIGLTSDETPSTKGSPQVRTKTYHLIPFLETEGEINVNDCRRKIWKDSRPLSFRKYTCSVDRNSEGKIISSICCRVDYASFSNECRTAYCYTKGG